MTDKAKAVAQILCARGFNRFCKNVGGTLGCKVGRGTSDRTKCIASDGQLTSSGAYRTAEDIINTLQTEGN